MRCRPSLWSWFLPFLLCLTPTVAVGQSYTVSGTSVFNGSSTSIKLTTGQVCFTPSAGGSPTCFSVVNGVFSGSVPTNTYDVAVTNTNSGQTILTLKSVPILTNWAFDSYIIPANTSGVPTYSGVGLPYLQCIASSYYLRTDPPNPLFATYTCGTLGQYTQWYLAPFNPSSQLDALSRPASFAFVYSQFKPSNLPALFAGVCPANQFYRPFSNDCATGGGNPGGGAAAVQYNNGGAFAGSAATLDAAGNFITPLLNQGQLRDNCGEKCNLLAYGAVADAQLSKVCSMTAGSAALTCDDAPFTAGDVGKAISVELAGATLSGPINGNLITTIASYTDTSHVTLAAVAGNTTPTGLIDVDGVALIGGTANADLGPGSLNNVAGATVTGIIGQTCTLTTFNNGLSAATASVLLSNTNTLTTGTPYAVTAGGGGGVGAPTTATLANGTATCSGTVTVTSSLDVGFGYYSGQWPTTTSGSGTGAVISIYDTLLGGGVNVNYQPPHWITFQGTGYAVNDTICPTITGANGHGCFKVTKVNKAAAIWGTDNFTAFTNWLAACNGTKNCFIPGGKFLTTSANNTHHINFASNTSVKMDPAGVIYPIGYQPGYCTSAGWYTFGTVDGTQAAPTNNIHIDGLNVEGEMQTSSNFYGCGPRVINIGQYMNNLEISHSTFNHTPGAGVAAFSAGGTGINIHHNYFDQNMDSASNVNTQGLDFSFNTMVNSPGIEAGGGPDVKITHNTFLNGEGFYMIGLGGSTGGRAWYGGIVEDNNMLNPLRNGISIGSGFSRGRVCGNTIAGMTGWYSQNFGILQGSSGAYVPTFGNMICNNKLISTPGSSANEAYGGIGITSYNGPLGNLQGDVLMNNSAEGFFVPGGLSGSGGTLIGIGNTWNGDGINGHYDFSISSGNVLYSAQNDVLMHGSYSAHNVPNSPLAWITGSFSNGTTGQPFQIGPLYQQLGDFSSVGLLNYLTNSGTLQGYGLASLQVTLPQAPGVTPVGTTGATTYTYYCTAVSGNGAETNAGTAASTTTGNATLSGSNYNTVTCPLTLGAATMNVYRTVGGASQGRIATGLLNFPTTSVLVARTVNDTGLAGTGSFAPATNQTGGIKLVGVQYQPAGTGVALTTGPSASTTDHVMTAKDTAGGVKDSGISINSLCQTSGTNCPAAGTTTTVASGTTALATSAIASGACQTVTAGSVNSSAATGVLTTDVIMVNPNATIKAVTGYVPSTSGGLMVTPYPTADFVNFDVCNWTSASITPGAVTLNWRVVR